MNWTEQAEAMLKTWTEAQKQVWSGWYDLARSGPGMSSMSGMPNMADPMGWLRQGMQAWTAGTGPTGQGVASQLFGSQATMMRSLELLTKAWQTIAPKIESGQDWQSTLQTFTSQWVEDMMGIPQRAMGAGKDVNDLMRSFAGEWGPLIGPMLASLNQAGMAGHMGGALMGGTSGLSKLFGMGIDMEPAFESFAQIPSIGVSREQNAKILRAFDAFVDFRKVNMKYHAALAKGMEQAVHRTMEELAQLSKKGEQITSVRELMSIWVRMADKTFTEMYGTEEYAALQKEMSAAGMRFKIKLHDVVEMIQVALHMPTRSELDDAYRTLYLLKKEVKELKKALAASEPQAQLEAKTPATPAKRKTATPAKPKASEA